MPPESPRGKGPCGLFSGHSRLLHLQWPLITNYWNPWYCTMKRTVPTNLRDVLAFIQVNSLERISFRHSQSVTEIQKFSNVFHLKFLKGNNKTKQKNQQLQSVTEMQGNVVGWWFLCWTTDRVVLIRAQFRITGEIKSTKESSGPSGRNLSRYLLHETTKNISTTPFNSIKNPATPPVPRARENHLAMHPVYLPFWKPSLIGWFWFFLQAYWPGYTIWNNIKVKIDRLFNSLYFLHGWLTLTSTC